MFENRLEKEKTGNFVCTWNLYKNIDILLLKLKLKLYKILFSTFLSLLGLGTLKICKNGLEFCIQYYNKLI